MLQIEVEGKRARVNFTEVGAFELILEPKMDA